VTEGDRAVRLRPQLRRRHRHLPADLPRPRQRLGGHQLRGPDGLLRPRDPRRPRLHHQLLQRLLRGPRHRGGRLRGQPAGQGPGQPRRGDGLRRRRDPLRRAHRRVLL